MPSAMQVQVLDRHQEKYSRTFSGSVELGRQNDGREELYAARTVRNGVWRVVIAPLDEDTVSRVHAHLEPLEGNRVRLTNRSGKVPIRLADGTELTAGASCELELPAVLALGRRTVQVLAPDPRTPEVRSLASVPAAPGQRSLMMSRFPTLTVADSVDLDNILGWLQTTLDLLQSAATSTDFFQKAAQAVVDMVNCDSGRVLLRRDGPWVPAAPVGEDGPWVTAAFCKAPHATVSPSWRVSQKVLARVLAEKKTFLLRPDTGETRLSESLLGVEAVVAAPILDRDGNVIGALYGDCRTDRLGRPGLTELQARLVEVLAGGVANGLARLEQEKAALEAEVRFGQFFTPELAQQLAENKDLLKGRECEVTLLFADVRRFSHISEGLKAAGTVELIGDVMDRLSDCVRAHQGVLVDYIGDELIAMWGAPVAQPDHARLACRAAQDMLGALKGLNEVWQERLKGPLDLGIGINTGPAWVGNMGSRHKFKYGPLGPTVNLASRVQGATKYLRSRLLLTENTQKQLGPGFATRRLCKVRVVNMDQVIDLYELVSDPSPASAELTARYEEALAEFERGECGAATRRLSHLFGLHADDGPALVMLWRALHQLIEPAKEFDHVWELPGK
jgi:adenylate cyclase